MAFGCWGKLCGWTTGWLWLQEVKNTFSESKIGRPIDIVVWPLLRMNIRSELGKKPTYGTRFFRSFLDLTVNAQLPHHVCQDETPDSQVNAF